MNKKQYFFYLRALCYIGMIVFISQTVIHLSGIRLAGAEQLWPLAQRSFIELFMMLWGVATACFVGILFIVQKDFQKNAELVRFLGWISLLLGIVTLYESRIPFQEILPLENMYLWFPYYSAWLKLEALGAIFSFGFIHWGNYKRYFSAK
jgi:hypothetical protein